mgnify:CR=1 FL=1
MKEQEEEYNNIHWVNKKAQLHQGGRDSVFWWCYAIFGHKFNPYCLKASGSLFKYRTGAAPELLEDLIQ